jgi:hypothetical protein
MTLAPWSASTIVQYGPDSTRVKSITVNPESAPLIQRILLRHMRIVVYTGEG